MPSDKRYSGIKVKSRSVPPLKIDSVTTIKEANFDSRKAETVSKNWKEELLSKSTFSGRTLLVLFLEPGNLILIIK